VSVGGLPFSSIGYAAGAVCGRGMPEGEGFALMAGVGAVFNIMAQEGSGTYDYLKHSEIPYTTGSTLMFFNLTYPAT
jgi:hypothetical protein